MEVKQNTDFVTDRSPLDNLVYYTLQASWNQGKDDMNTIFIDKCKEAMSEVTHLIYIKPCQPDGKVEDNGSRISNKLYQEAVDSVFHAFLPKLIRQPTKLLILDFWDLDLRKQVVSEFLKGSKPPVSSVL